MCTCLSFFYTVSAQAPDALPRLSSRWKRKKYASISQVAGSIEAVSIGLDLTLRELQGKLKKAGHPWEVSKVFPGSAIIGKPSLMKHD